MIYPHWAIEQRPGQMPLPGFESKHTIPVERVTALAKKILVAHATGLNERALTTDPPNQDDLDSADKALAGAAAIQAWLDQQRASESL
jgi:hypothetical protein